MICLIHKSKANKYWAIVRATWITAGIIKPTDPELLIGERYLDDDGNVIGWKIDHHSHSLRLKFGGSECSVDIHKELANTDVGDDWIRVREHSYHYQSHPGDTRGPLSFRIDLDPGVRLALHANPDHSLVQSGQMAAHLGPEELDLDIRDFDALQFVYVANLYREGKAYPLDPMIDDDYHDGIALIRREVGI